MLVNMQNRDYHSEKRPMCSPKAQKPPKPKPLAEYDAEDLTSPRFWQDKVKERDNEINKLNVMLNETEGKL